MSDEREEILRKLNERQAESGIDPETRHVIGLLGEAVRTLGEEIDDLQQQVEELKSEQLQTEEEEYSWYSEQ